MQAPKVRAKHFWICLLVDKPAISFGYLGKKCKIKYF